MQAVHLDQNGTIDASDTEGDGVPDAGAELIRTSCEYDEAGAADSDDRSGRVGDEICV